jgi:hypothetical protein
MLRLRSAARRAASVSGFTPPNKYSRWLRLAVIAVMAGWPAAAGSGQNSPLTVADPMRCWWRTGAPAVRVGEPLAIVLTCAVLDSPVLTVVVDEAQLGSETVSFAPFEVLESARAGELRAGDQRFVQHRYRVRLLSDSAFGTDVAIPGISLHYRAQSRGEDGTAIEGIERTYTLPPLSVHVLSLVPADAADIREAAVPEFDAIETAAFRARMLMTGGAALLALGTLLMVVAAYQFAVRDRTAASRTSAQLSEQTILRAATRELASVRAARDADGWSPALAARALAVVRIVCAASLGRPVVQRPAADARTDEGAIVVVGRSGARIAVSSSVTAHTMDRARRAAIEGRDENGRLTSLRDALSVLTGARYGSQSELPTDRLDTALGETEAFTRDLRSTSRWATRSLKGLLARVPYLNRQAWSD